MKDPRGVLITGANSGIGEALAVHYAQTHTGILLVLTGRNVERLASVKALCEQHGAQVETAAIDVTDESGMQRLVETSIEQGVELIIANAGVSEGTVRSSDPSVAIRGLFDVNVMGVLNTLLPALEPMRRRRKGQLAVVSSLTAYWSFNAYAATKAAVMRLVEGLRAPLAADGVEINVICPGFVRSRMTAASKYPMPLLWEAEDAARYTAEALSSNQEIICFPFVAYALMAFLSILPSFITKFIWRFVGPKDPALSDKQH